jgi:hypothetical protein
VNPDIRKDKWTAAEDAKVRRGEHTRGEHTRGWNTLGEEHTRDELSSRKTRNKLCPFFKIVFFFYVLIPASPPALSS